MKTFNGKYLAFLVTVFLFIISYPPAAEESDLSTYFKVAGNIAPEIAANADFNQDFRLFGDTLWQGSLGIVKALEIDPQFTPGGLLNLTANILTDSTIWGPEQRLTYIIDSTYLTNRPILSVSGDTVYVAFSLDVDMPGIADLPFLMCSHDDGNSWSDIWCVTNIDTALYAWDNFVYYYDHRLNLGSENIWSPNYDRYNMYTKYSEDGGISWSIPEYYFDEGQYFLGKGEGCGYKDTLFCSIYIGENHDEVDVDSIAFTTSFNNGTTWTPLRNIVWHENNNYWHWIRYSQGRIHLLYQDKSFPSQLTEIFYTRSDNYGLSWSQPLIVSDDSCQHSQWPYLFVSEDGKLIASWYDYKYGSGHGGFTGDILYRVSIDNGDSWGSECQLTNHHDATASRSFINGSHMGFIWEDTRSGFFSPEFYYTESFDGGETWTPELRLTNAPMASRAPYLVLSDNKLYFVWQDGRHDLTYGNQEVYFRKADLPIISGIEEILEFPGEFFLSAFPNPFNNVLNIEIPSMGGGESEIKIYDITGRLIRILNAKEGKTTWDAVDDSGQKASSGIYFIRVETPQRQLSTKILFLK